MAARVARVRFLVWLRNVAQVEPSALMRCGRFSSTLTTIFLVACGVFRSGDVAKLVNNIFYLL
jgi:hypothetical protein